jgi:hypothetical protein
LGWAKVNHPFHPLKGQSFPVLKTRWLSGRETLILRDLERGSISVLREWTDWAGPSILQALGKDPQRFALSRLLELIELVQRLRKLDV